MNKYRWMLLPVMGLLLSFWCAQPLLLAVDSSSTEGDALKHQFEEVQQLLDRGRVDEAVTVLQRLYTEYPHDASAALNLGNSYKQRQDYAQSVLYYEEGLRRSRQIAPPDDKNIAIIHHELVDSYNELGQQRYFSPELCLRILYHLEQAWPYLAEVGSPSEDMAKMIEFARKTVGHHDAATMGPNVRIREASTQQEVNAMTAQTQDPELLLPPDGIDATMKLQAKKSIIARMRAFDAAQPSEYALTPSDRSLEAILKTTDMAFSRIANIHYRKYQQREGTAELIEETWYQSPNVLKTRRRQNGQNGWLLIRDRQLTTFDPVQHRIFNQEAMENEPGWLMEVRKPHTKYLQQGFDFTAQKLTVPPVFLGSLYQDQPTAQLYLLTGTSKNPDGTGEPPVVKVEYIVDWDRGLLVGLREYWHGVLASGREEDLAVTDIVTRWTEYSQGIVLPVAGQREQLIDEPPAAHRVERAKWRIEYGSVNEVFDPSGFDLSRYTKP